MDSNAADDHAATIYATATICSATTATVHATAAINDATAAADDDDAATTVHATAATAVRSNGNHMSTDTVHSTTTSVTIQGTIPGDSWL